MSDQEQLYSSQQVALLFQVARETIRNYSAEFSEYLSTLATPGYGKRRMFINDDLHVFALITALKKQGMTYADIHASLRNGQRADPPPLPPGGMQALMVSKQERPTEMSVEYLQQSIRQLQLQLEVAQNEIAELQEVKTVSIRQTVLLEEREKQLNELKAQLTATLEENKRLLQENGKEYSRGMMDALERQGLWGKKSNSVD